MLCAGVHFFDMSLPMPRAALHCLTLQQNNSGDWELESSAVAMRKVPQRLHRWRTWRRACASRRMRSGS